MPTDYDVAIEYNTDEINNFSGFFFFRRRVAATACTVTVGGAQTGSPRLTYVFIDANVHRRTFKRTSGARAGGKFSPFVAASESSSLGDEVTIIAIPRGRGR